MRGFHGITPETDSSTHYFWSMASSSHPDMPDNSELVYEQTAQTFAEDKVIIEAQYRNICRFQRGEQIDLRVDAGANRGRRTVARLVSEQEKLEA
jgi:vanillate O-demethylase monooxygenase subunit